MGSQSIVKLTRTSSQSAAGLLNFSCAIKVFWPTKAVAAISTQMQKVQRMTATSRDSVKGDALDSVKKAYEVWAKAYGTLSQDDFLKHIAKLQGTGKNAREIVEFVQHHPQKWK